MCDFEEGGAEPRSSKSLGSWFPSATVVKGLKYDSNASITIALFYQYIRPLWSETQKSAALQLVERNGSVMNVGGRIRVAREGINATLSGCDDDVRRYIAALAEFDSHFNSTDVKYITSLPADRAFKDLRVLPVKELVYYGIDAEAELGPGGVHLDPEEYHKKLSQPNTVVIDVRNKYESDIGRFEKQEGLGGATLLVPDMRKSTDFPEWIAREETKEMLKGKEVLMYCTGGVRCERASSLLKHQYGDSISGVYQLQGGIEKYLQHHADGGFWKGKNYVFDKREAFAPGDKSGVGGVVVNPKKKRKAEVSEEILGHCCVCNVEWDRYIGKKKCYVCGVPVLMCDGCCTKKVDKIPGQELSVRCPLCVAEGCVVPVAEVSFTDNGVRAKTDAETLKGKAAPTVCKWGGGHASQKKQKRQEDRAQKKWKQLPCKYGAGCTRKDCWFSHELQS